MDIRINSNVNMQIQNEYLQRAAENISAEKESGSGRRTVLERNLGAFKRIADICYDRSEVYAGRASASTDENEQIAGANYSTASMIECIDMLKNSVTPEDYSQLEAWGLIPDEDNPEAFVTVYDRIQIELAAHCEDYDIKGLNINKEKMKAVLGSSSMANAVSMANDMAGEVSVLSDDTKKYLISNEMDTTLENVYKAIHCGASGDVSTSLSDGQWQQLQSQVKGFFEANGIEVNSENLDSARWIISSEIPLTVDNFEKLSALNDVDFSDENYMESLRQDMAYTVYFGGNAMATDVTGQTFNMEKVHEAVDTIQGAMDQDVDYIIKNNKKLNIENLKLRIEERKREQNEAQTKDTYTKESKVLAEARAVLTAGSLFMMQKAGINISAVELTVLVDMSHTSNTSYAEQLFALDNYIPDDNERELLTKTVEIMSGFASLPIAVAASLYNETIDNTVEAVYEEGKQLEARYRQASMTYEAVGTEVRADLGDSISKAFRNIDDILTACGVDINDKNRRAARVLGYNSIDIDAQSVEAMREITTELDELTENLTPRAAMHLIKNGINPLQTDIGELNEMLEEVNATLGAGTEDERYSEYLWKLEKNKSITKEERDAYIQIYRIINHINRQDGRAVGAVAKAGQEMTLSNLYTAVKTKQTGSVDKKIDDSTGLFDGTYTEDALTKYLENAVRMMEDDELHREYAYERMQEKLSAIEPVQTMTEEAFMRYISGAGNISVNAVYNAMSAGDSKLYKKLMSLEDEKLRSATDKISQVWQQSDETADDAVMEAEIVGAYEELSDAMAVENTEATYDKAVTRTDMHQAVSFMAEQARNRSYYIPMEMNGDTAMVHLTIKQGSEDEKGKISIYTKTQEGQISVLMYKEENDYNTLVITDSHELRSKLEELCQEGARIVYTDRMSEGMWDDSDIVKSGYAEVSYGELVRQAKSFIHTVLKRM